MHGEGREANSLLFAVHSILIHVAIDLYFYMNNCPKKCSNEGMILCLIENVLLYQQGKQQLSCTSISACKRFTNRRNLNSDK
jgi:hypothetical protein